MSDLEPNMGGQTPPQSGDEWQRYDPREWDKAGEKGKKKEGQGGQSSSSSTTSSAFSNPLTSEFDIFDSPPPTGRSRFRAHGTYSPSSPSYLLHSDPNRDRDSLDDNPFLRRDGERGSSVSPQNQGQSPDSSAYPSYPAPPLYSLTPSAPPLSRTETYRPFSTWRGTGTGPLLPLARSTNNPYRYADTTLYPPPYVPPHSPTSTRPEPSAPPRSPLTHFTPSSWGDRNTPPPTESSGGSIPRIYDSGWGRSPSPSSASDPSASPMDDSEQGTDSSSGLNPWLTLEAAGTFCTNLLENESTAYKIARGVLITTVILALVGLGLGLTAATCGIVPAAMAIGAAIAAHKVVFGVGMGAAVLSGCCFGFLSSRKNDDGSCVDAIVPFYMNRSTPSAY